METLKKAHGVCPYCGKGIPSNGQMQFGSPVQTCKRCKKQYVDTSYQELAISGIPDAVFSVKNRLKLLALLGVIFVVAAGLTVQCIVTQGSVPVKGFIASVLTLPMCVYVLWDILQIKTGRKLKKMERKREESEARLSDPVYAQTLHDAGYAVPERFLRQRNDL